MERNPSGPGEEPFHEECSRKGQRERKRNEKEKGGEPGQRIAKIPENLERGVKKRNHKFKTLKAKRLRIN